VCTEFLDNFQNKLFWFSLCAHTHSSRIRWRVCAGLLHDWKCRSRPRSAVSQDSLTNRIVWAALPKSLFSPPLLLLCVCADFPFRWLDLRRIWHEIIAGALTDDWGSGATPLPHQVMRLWLGCTSRGLGCWRVIHGGNFFFYPPLLFRGKNYLHKSRNKRTQISDEFRTFRATYQPKLAAWPKVFLYFCLLFGYTIITRREEKQFKQYVWV
jgi:hypothetical protein